MTALSPLAEVARSRALRNCRLIDLPRFTDTRGHLTFVEAGVHIPFVVQRVYYMYGVPGHAERGGHAYRELQQVVIAVAGRFEAVLTDGHAERRFVLDRPDVGLYLDPCIWRRLVGFSEDAVCLVLASRHFDASEREDDFERYRRDAR